MSLIDLINASKSEKQNFGVRKYFRDNAAEGNHSKRIVLVGTGGIGCELLKNLLCCGFNDIEIVDLDTIELSNLNRQFLFRTEDIGKSKAKVAKERALKFSAKKSKIIAHHKNIRDPEMGPDFFSKFDIIVNALDNLPTRRHVNRICLALGKPLVESGTQGYLGQVYLIEGGRTECYECVAKPAPKTFPVCTIRDTPSKPVHCIAWAKMVIDSFFGPKDLVNDLSDLKIERKESESAAQFAERLFDHLFGESIDKRKELKSNGKEGEEIQSENIQSNGEKTNGEIGSKTLKKTDKMPTAIYFQKLQKSPSANGEHKLKILKHAADFVSSVEKIFSLGMENKTLFDKDDEVALGFVDAASNLRMANFSIPGTSRFETKGIAGNIIHAIATTNAVCAGLMALDIEKISKGDSKACKRSWIQLDFFGAAMIITETLPPPSEDCFSCSKKTLELICNVKELTVKQLFEDVLKKKLSMIAPVVDVSYGQAVNFISEDVSEWEDNEKWKERYFSNPLAHEAVKIRHGSVLTVGDDRQSFSVRIIVKHCQKRKDLGEEEGVIFKIEKRKKFFIDNFDEDQRALGGGDKRKIEKNKTDEKKKIQKS